MAVLNTSVNRTVAPGIGMQLGNTGGQYHALPVGKPIPFQIGQQPTATQSAPQAAPPQAVPQTGLIGSEQALQGALAGSQNTLGGAMTSGLATLGAGASTAQTTLGNAAAAVAGPQSYGTGMGQVNQAIGQGVDAMAGYTGFGGGAAERQAALSGARGPEAQAQAMAAYQDSPYVDQARQNAEQAIMRNAAVTGGLGGGRTLDQLYQNAAGMFMNDYQNQFNNLGQVTNTGLTAAGQVSNLKGQEANIASQLQQANISSKTQQQIASQQLKANLQSQLADAAMTAGVQGAGIITQTGGMMANDIMNTGQMIGQGRTQAGQAIAQNATQAAAGISNLLNQQGVNVSDMMAKDIASVTDLIYQSGMQGKTDNQQLAAILANISGGQGSTAMQGYNQLGLSQAAGIVGATNAVQGGAEMYLEHRK